MARREESKLLPVTWDSLNPRQQSYLVAIYSADQEVEADERSKWSRGGRPRPAAEWRWMMYATLNGFDTPVKRHIRAASQIDEGTGSTFEALEKRKLIMVRYDLDTYNGIKVLSNEPIPAPIPSIQITKEGRALVRKALEIRPSTQNVVGTLQEWHWRALAYAYLHGAGNTEKSRIGWKTWLRLRDYKVAGVEHPLVEDSLRITPFGMAFYERAHVRYSQLYAEVSAPEPRTSVNPYEPFVEVVQGRRGCRACRGYYLVAIRRTYQQSRKWTWSVDEQEQRIEGLVTVEWGPPIWQCSCQESDIQEVRAPLLALLDQLQGWQLHFPYHDWYRYLGYLVTGVGSLYQDLEKDWYEPGLVREKLLPLLDTPDEKDERNIVKDGHVLYCVNPCVGKGSIYPTTLGMLNQKPVALTRMSQGIVEVKQ